MNQIPASDMPFLNKIAYTARALATPQSSMKEVEQAVAAKLFITNLYATEITFADKRWNNAVRAAILDAIQPPCAHGVKASVGCQECTLQMLVEMTGRSIEDLRAAAQKAGA